MPATSQRRARSARQAAPRVPQRRRQAPTDSPEHLNLKCHAIARSRQSHRQGFCEFYLRLKKKAQLVTKNNEKLNLRFIVYHMNNYETMVQWVNSNENTIITTTLEINWLIFLLRGASRIFLGATRTLRVDQHRSTQMHLK